MVCLIVGACYALHEATFLLVTVTVAPVHIGTV